MTGVDTMEHFVADGLGLHPVLGASAELAMMARTAPGPCEKIRDDQAFGL